MRYTYFYIFLLIVFSACEKQDAPEDPNRLQQLEIGDDKILDINQVVLQKSSFGNQGTLYILSEGLNYNEDAFTIEGTGDYIQFSLIVNFGNDIDGGIYRFSQFFGDPFTINFGQIAENYNWGGCFCTNVSDVILEVKPLESKNNYELDLIGRNTQDKIFKAYFKGEIIVQLF